MMVDSVPGEGGVAYNPYPMERPKTSHGRPKTGHGRRRSAADESNTQPMEVPPSIETDMPPRPTTSRSNRPRTSHGRRPPDQQQLMQQHQQRYLQQEQEQYEQQQQQQHYQQQQHHHQQQQQQQHQQQQHYIQDEYPTERPKTSHGRRRSSLQLMRQDSSPRPHVTPDRDSQPSPYRAPSSMRPMTGSSMSHYAVLPPIGAKPEQPPPSPPRLGERSVTMLNLKNDVQIMKLEDDASDNEDDTGLSAEEKETRESEANETRQSIEKSLSKSPTAHTATDTDSLVVLRDSSSMSGGKPTSEEPPPFRPLTRENTLSEEPSEEKDTVILAVKLPDGQRVSRRFRKDETMGMVMHFAEVSSHFDLAGYDLVCDAPRKVYKDLNITVGESGLATRTVLHIRFPDDSDQLDN